MAAKKAGAKTPVVKAASAADKENGASAPSSDVQDQAGIKPAAGAVGGTEQGNQDGAGQPGDNESASDSDADSAGPGAGDITGADATKGGAGAATDGAQGPDAGTAPPDSTVSGNSVNALSTEGANALTSESTDAPIIKPDPDADADDLSDDLKSDDDSADDGRDADDSNGLGDDLESENDDDQASETAQTPSETAPLEPVILGAWELPTITEFPASLTLTNNTASRFVVLGKGIPVDESLVMEVTEQQFLKLAKSLVSHVRLDKWDNVRGLQVAHESND